MTKSELIDEIAGVLDTSEEAKAAVESLLSGITDALSHGESVTLTGFGTFKIARRKARKARIPHSGETIMIGERDVVKFVPGKHLKEATS